MLPTKLTADDPESKRALYKIVRRDTFEDIPGLILTADTTSGICLMRVVEYGATKDVEHNYGPEGFSIIPRKG